YQEGAGRTRTVIIVLIAAVVIAGRLVAGAPILKARMNSSLGGPGQARQYAAPRDPRPIYALMPSFVVDAGPALTAGWWDPTSVIDMTGSFRSLRTASSGLSGVRVSGMPRSLPVICVE